MSDKVIKLDNTTKYYKRLAEEKADRNDLLGSLSLLLACKDKTKGVMIYADIADLYFDMGHYDLSIRYWYRFLNMVSKKNYSIAYNGLGASYFYLGNVNMAGYYFNEQLSAVHDPSKVYIDDNMMEYFDDVVSGRKDYKIVYPFTSVDYTDVLDAGKRKIMHGDYDGALETLSEVQPRSEHYVDALCERAVAYFFKGDVRDSVEESKKALIYDPNCVRAFCSLASVYYYCGQYEQAALCLKHAEEIESMDDESTYKLATTFCEQGKHGKALRYLSKLIETNPYEIKILHLMGIAYYNTGDFAKAQECFHKIIRITQKNPTALYYYRLSGEQIAAGTKNAKPLTYFFRIPDEEQEKRVKELKDLLQIPPKDRCKKIEKKELIELIDWAFSTMNIELMMLAVGILASLNEPFATDYLLDILLDASVYDDVKEVVVYRLSLKQYDKKTGVVFGNFFKKIQFMSLDLSEEKDADLFICAYAEAFTKLLLFGEERFEQLVEVTRRLFYEFLLCGRLNEIKDSTVLAAVLALMCGSDSCKGFNKAAKMFKQEVESIKNLLALVNEVEGND